MSNLGRHVVESSSPLKLRLSRWESDGGAPLREFVEPDLVGAHGGPPPAGTATGKAEAGKIENEKKEQQLEALATEHEELIELLALEAGRCARRG